VLSLATQPWVFSLDADEELSPELCDEIKLFSRTERPRTGAGSACPRCVFYEGKWIRHGDWYPDRLVRLFRRDRAKVSWRQGPTNDWKWKAGSFRCMGNSTTTRSKMRRTIGRAVREIRAALGRDQARRGQDDQRFSTLSTRGLSLARAVTCSGAGSSMADHGWRIARVCAREVFLKYRLLRELSR